MTVAITDNDGAGIEVVPSGGNTTVVEGGAGDSYTIRLTGRPAAEVTITLTPDAQVSVVQPVSRTLTFTTTNWSTAQTVSVSAVDDARAEGNHTSSISHRVTSNDPNYNNFNVPPMNVDITDNDRASVVVAESGGNTAVGENGATDTFTVVLTSQPTAPVTVTLNSGTQLTVTPVALVFNSTDWNVPKTVTVAAVNDLVAEGNHSGLARFAVTSADTTYDGISVPDVPVTITDNDQAGIALAESGNSTAVTEGGTTDTYTLVLMSQPTANVTITLSSGTQLTVAAATLTFTPANWNTAQIVTVTAVDDFRAEGNHGGTIVHGVTSNDPNYNGAAVPNVAAAITDNDRVGVTLTQTGDSTAVTEGGATDTYTVVLTSQPIANVRIGVIPDSQVSATPLVLTFTPADWNTAQTVTVTAVNDARAEGNHTGAISHGTASDDPAYNGLLVPGVSVAITDNDRAGVTVAESGGTTAVAEGGATDTYTVVLSSQPTADVLVALSPGTQLTVAPTLTFTPANWNTPQTVTVTAVDDRVVEGSHSGTISHAVTSGDAAYNGLTVRTVNIAITDNDTAGVTVGESGGSTSVTEGGSGDSFTLVLATQPTADVYLILNAGTQLRLSATTVTFGVATWNTPQTVTVNAVDDSAVEGAHAGTVGFTVSSADAGYNGLSVPGLNVGIVDNDQAGVVLVESAGSTAVTEGGSSDSYTLVLTSQPTANVVVTLDPGPQLTATPGTVTFTSSNWNTPQIITVTALDNPRADGNRTAVITHTITSGDANYNARPVPNVNVAITDNDRAGIVLTESGGNTAVAEGGATDTYTLVLTSQPSANVLITLSTGNQLLVASSPVTFTPSNWNTPQTVIVTAVDDALVEGTHTAAVSHTVTSNDAAYNGQAVPTVTATISDNERIGVTLVESGGSTSVAEGGATDSYTLVLTSRPSANVTVTLALTPGSQLGAVSPLTFTPANWNTPQTVTLTAVDDPIAEGSHAVRVRHTLASSDAAYNGLLVPDVIATIADNDRAGVLVVESGGATAVAEGGATDTYTLVLTSQPTANVTITLSAGTQLAVLPTSLTFTPANWNVAQTVTVTAVDDTLVEGAHTGTVGHAVASTDATYNGLAAPTVTAAIVDNERPGQLAFAPASYSVAEPAGSVTVTVVRSGGADGTIAVRYATADGTATAGSDYTAAFGTLTFQPGETSKTVAVAVTADTAVEGSETFVVALTAPTGLATLGTPAGAAVAIVDNRAPAAQDDLYLVGSRTAASASDVGVLRNDTDPDNDALTATVGTAPTLGGVTLRSDGTFTYTPGSGFWGVDSFTYTASDGRAASAAARVTVMTQPARLVQKLHQQVVGHDPDAARWRDWTDLTTNRASTLGQLSSGLLESAERIDPIVRQMYRDYLLRVADEGGLAFWRGIWQRDGGPDNVQAGIVASPEFFQSAGGTNRAWMTELYRRLLRREPDQGGLDFWTGSLDRGMPRDQVVLAFVRSQENFRNLAREWYQRYLNRAATVQEENAVVARMSAGSSQRAEQALLIDTAEYAATPAVPPSGSARRQ